MPSFTAVFGHSCGCCPSHSREIEAADEDAARDIAQDEEDSSNGDIVLQYVLHEDDD